MAGETARAYHRATAHTPRSVMESGWRLDWSNRPHPFKEYDEGPQRITLADQPPETGVPALEAVAAVEPIGEAAPFDLEQLSRLLRLGAGVHRRVTYADGETWWFRTYASAGALYPVEVYVLCGDLEGLENGSYHFDPRGSLLRLSEGDPRPELVRVTVGEPAVATAPLVLAITGIPWRTAWKYTERGYRHLFWDAGMVVANVLSLAASAGWPAHVVLGFDDAEVATLLGLDDREMPLCLVAIGRGEAVGESPEPPVAPRIRAGPLSRHEVDFPDVARVHRAGELERDAVRRWREASLPRHEAAAGTGEPGPPPASDGIERVIRRRGSARGFRRDPVPAGVLATILDRATRGIATDYAPEGSAPIAPFLVANGLDGVPAGAYVFGAEAFHPLREGDFRAEAGFLCLDQRLGADAAATHFLMAPLEEALRAFGDRGYRVAQLEGGIVAGRIYLGAYAHRLGATGLTFFDDEVSRFFAPASEALACMLVTAVGASRRPIR